MNKRKKSVVTFVLTFLVVCFIGMAELSADSDAERVSNPVADEMIGPSGITWVPKINYRQLVLTVSRPDGTVFTKTIESGSAPHVNLSEILESSFTDGSYTYQLVVIPVVERKIRTEQDHFLTAGSKNERTRYKKALTQSGSFMVQGGAIVLADVPEFGASKPQDELSSTLDVCYNDDLIVDGSLCVGFDCTCNYSFGFDTIVLKENNLRIFFDDTSASASYPRNDWRIIINDSANGGASYFGVEDSTAGRRVFTLEAGAPSHSLYVDDGGRVGLGTSTPVVDVHIKSGNTPTLRLEQDGSSGFAPQTFDVASNEANFFIRDATNGSTLPFRIQPGAPSSVLTVRADGNVGIGTWSPSANLHVVNAGPTKLVLENTDQDKWTFNSSGNGFRINANDSATVLFRLTNTGDLTIEGDITANGTCCADYVFEPDYSLMPLTELSEFIKKEKHLPNIPTAAEMKENGVNMSELQIKLLEKVEELTLYTISLQETVTELKKEIAALKKK